MSLKTLNNLKNYYSDAYTAEEEYQNNSTTKTNKAKKGELSVEELIQILKHCPQKETIWTGKLFSKERIQAVNIDDDGSVSLLSVKDNDKLRRSYGRMVTKNGIQKAEL